MRDPSLDVRFSVVGVEAERLVEVEDGPRKVLSVKVCYSTLAVGYRG